MISRLLFVVCLGWFLLVMGITFLGYSNFPHPITDGELQFALMLACAPPLAIAGGVRLVRWIISG